MKSKVEAKVGSAEQATTLIVPLLTTAAFIGITTCVSVGIFCRANNIHSADDFRNYREMRSVTNPVVVAFADGLLTVGSTKQELLSLDTPYWTDSYGRCEIYGFMPKRSYDYQTVVTVNSRVVSAHIGSCTWRWTFCDEMPVEVADAVASVISLRAMIERMPDDKDVLQPMLDEKLAFLEMPLAETGREK